MLNTAGDPLPANAKLGWWSEELRSWAGQRSRHPLGRVLEPVRAPWGQLAEALPDLIEARDAIADPEQARRSLQRLAAAVAAVEAVLFDAPLSPEAGDAVLTQMLAQRMQDLGGAAVPAGSGGEREWQHALLARWPARVAGPRPRRLYAVLARGRLQACLRGGDYQPSPAVGGGPRAADLPAGHWHAIRNSAVRCVMAHSCRNSPQGTPKARRKTRSVFMLPPCRRQPFRPSTGEVKNRSRRFFAPLALLCGQPLLPVSPVQPRCAPQCAPAITFRAPAPAADQSAHRTSSSPNADAARSRARWHRPRRSPGPARCGRRPSRRCATGAGSWS